MKYFAEKDAEKLLKKNGFDVLEGIFVKTEKELENAIKKIGSPLVMKISGKNIVHKNKINGVRVGVNSYEESIKVFNEFKKIEGFEEVLIQKQISGREFLLGIKKTPEFGHAILVGAGGIHTEELKDISFRICPVKKKDVSEMVREIKISQGLDENSLKKIEIVLWKLCKLAQKYPDISELDINPLIVNEKEAIIVDARIAFE